ncbi:MAG TPA: serine hydrolase domain-containing protein [Geminicoccus sp.]|jgi:CubicO group peptidase (beta-lactamase class C family)|uniref:serine hydrolase domain-containing protein n=1 Tax=Geminicoccus sp. TaxID=2024832 RepID=UPI002E300F4D|nr:serine hydrolase domain-containing protein [Geminicoccus sp.]HEX2528660.1 serine hydrolase domain-containing protein [Geminicoccus sp.]
MKDTAQLEDDEPAEKGVLSRRRFVHVATAVAGGALLPAAVSASHLDPDDADLFRQLDRKIQRGMRELGIPGVAVGLIYRGKEYVRGYGVTDVRHPRPVDGRTVFRIASNSKTFAGTAAMRLVDEGRLDLDAPVKHYVTDFRPPRGAEGVTVRQVLNHSAGWLGYDYHDTGTDKPALARYVRDIHRLPQLTPVGKTFSYSNAAISVAGRVIETITGTSFESSVRRLVLEPLGMTDSGYNARILGKGNQATPHDVVDGKPVADPDLLYLPRSCNPFGGLLSSANDMVTYARFHLGDGRAENGRRVMSKRSLNSMWTRVGPGGTLLVELNGAGVSWMVRPTREGPVVVHHGGDLPGFHSGLMLVPEKNFAMTMLTNSEAGPLLIAQFFYQDWALRRFAGVSNLPAEPQSLTGAELAPYEGRYTAQQIGFDDVTVDIPLRIVRNRGRLTMIEGEGDNSTTRVLTFYKRDFVLVDDIGLRANFLRDAHDRVVWFRLGGRLFRRLG